MTQSYRFIEKQVETCPICVILSFITEETCKKKNKKVITDITP